MTMHSSTSSASVNEWGPTRIVDLFGSSSSPTAQRSSTTPVTSVVFFVAVQRYVTVGGYPGGVAVRQAAKPNWRGKLNRIGSLKSTLGSGSKTSTGRRGSWRRRRRPPPAPALVPALATVLQSFPAPATSPAPAPLARLLIHLPPLETPPPCGLRTNTPRSSTRSSNVCTSR